MIRPLLGFHAKFAFFDEEVAAAAGERPAGYVVDRTRAKLGEQERVFATAKSAFEGWQKCRPGPLKASPGTLRTCSMNDWNDTHYASLTPVELVRGYD